MRRAILASCLLLSAPAFAGELIYHDSFGTGTGYVLCDENGENCTFPPAEGGEGRLACDSLADCHAWAADRCGSFALLISTYVSTADGIGVACFASCYSNSTWGGWGLLYSIEANCG